MNGKQKQIEKGSIPFKAEGRLLQELGLRLVASPEVALVELIKNAYDADSPSCLVETDDAAETLVVQDWGSGMNLSDFKTKWMRIATSSKVSGRLSPRFGRAITGAKGIGRFAVRYLGDYLSIDTVAYDPKRKCKTRLVAEFDWANLDLAEDIGDVEVEFRLLAEPDETPTGTRLEIGQLRAGTDFTDPKQLRAEVLKIVSPLSGLERGKFSNPVIANGADPGFSVRLPDGAEAEDETGTLAGQLLSHYWARLTIDLSGDKLRYKVWLRDSIRPTTLSLKVNSSISKGLFADIRFFPKRKGVFQGKEVKGPQAWEWVRANSGVAVVDHGFRTPPFGYSDDDWLELDRDNSHRKRDWSSKIAGKHFPISEEFAPYPAENPALNLPSNFQLVGAVFVESRPLGNQGDDVDLTPSMDREGFLENLAFDQLWEYVRAGVEFLAHVDKLELRRIAEEEAKREAASVRKDFREAIEHIRQSPTLTRADKSRIILEYTALAERVEEQEEYSVQARRSLLTMSLLGVVAGFMTHESKALVHDLERSVEIIRQMSKKNKELESAAQDIARRVESFKGYLDYTRGFVQNAGKLTGKPIPAAGQVRVVMSRFKDFAEERGIEVRNEVDREVLSPPLPITAYSGVLLNLYTNSLKAVIANEKSGEKPTIVFRGWNEKSRHIIEVMDNGVGIPLTLQKRIWDPLFTTTSDLGNPLGSGMGLGLPLVRQVVSEFKGRIELVDDPPGGFTTCFRVSFPFL